MADEWVLTVDGGATNCRGVMYRNGEIVARASGPAANAWWGVEDTMNSLQSVWRSVAQALGLPEDPQTSQIRLVAGLAGAELSRIRKALLEQLAGFRQPRILTDGYAALVGAGEGAPGTLMIIGTGSVVHRLYPDGSSRISGGWGMIAGDRGSAAWVGLETIRRWLQWEDGSRSPHASSSLRERLNAHIGTGREVKLSWLKNARPADYGSLAPWVVEAAAEGDAFSRDLLDRATQEISDSLLTLVDPDDPGDIYLAGGMADTFRPLLEEQYGLRTLTPRRDANHGCFLVGSGQAPAEHRAT
ncbi:MAG: BadF/BadG/BcrA/BcrD ATPase family protein [bacterium]